MKKTLEEAVLESAADWVYDSKSQLLRMLEEYIPKICPNGHEIDFLVDGIINEDILDQTTKEEQLEDSSVPFTFVVVPFGHHVYCYIKGILVDSEGKISVVLFGMYDDLDELMEVRDLHMMYDAEELASIASHLIVHKGKFKPTPHEK